MADGRSFPRRGGRAAEGDGLLNRYTGITRIVGSNPIPSASKSLFSLAFRERFELSVRFAAFGGLPDVRTSQSRTRDWLCARIPAFAAAAVSEGR